MKIPFNKPYLGKKEIQGIIRVVKSGKIGGNGPISREVENFMNDLFKVRFTLFTTSCTHALEMALVTLNIKENDEVILPSFSFVSAANAVVRLKARPVFVDIKKDYPNVDPIRIKEAITRKTKAIICIHYAGMSCDVKEIKKISRENNLFLIEDAAQAVGSKYKDDFLGTIGDIGCFSFHETKNFTCGEGGAFLTNNKEIALKAEIIREKGTNRSIFLRGDIDKYTWIDIGSSYVPSDILAVVILEQLKRMDYIIKKRKRIWLSYFKGLGDLEKKGKLILPKLPKYDYNWHLFYFRVYNQRQRDSILKKLRRLGIEATFHFVPLHLSPYARKNYGYKAGDLPVTEKTNSTLIRLPVYPELNYKKQDYIVDSVCRILR